MEPLQSVSGWEIGQLAALLHKIGGSEIGRAILRDEVTIEVREVIRKLVDKNGRLIPAKELTGNVCDPNKKFELTQPQNNTSKQFTRFMQFFPQDMQFVSVEEFTKRSVELVSQLRRNSLLSNLLEGVFIPVCFPKLEISDYGKSLEEIFLAAAEKAYSEQFPGRTFNNYRKGELAGKVEIISGSRHGKLLAKMAEGPVVGILLFPMQGFSINASRQQIPVLPEELLLSGAIDIMTAVTMYPDVLGRDFNTPGYLCSANSWRSAEYSLYAGADGDDFSFAHTGNLAVADVYYSSGLLFIG